MPLSGYLLRNESSCSHKYIYMNLNSHSSSIHNSGLQWKRPKWPSMDREAKCSESTGWNVTRPYKEAKRSTEKRLQWWTDLGIIMLSERSQTQKPTCYITPSMWNGHNRQLHRGREDRQGHWEEEPGSDFSVDLESPSRGGHTWEPGSAHDGLTVSVVNVTEGYPVRGTQRSSSYSMWFTPSKQNKKTSSRSQEAGFSSQY